MLSAIPSGSTSSNTSDSESESGESTMRGSLNDGSMTTANTSPGPSGSYSSEPKTLLSMWMNVEIGVALNKEQQDEFLTALAKLKRDIARTERRLARLCSEETSMLHDLNRLRMELADKRVEQADINIERTRHFRLQLQTLERSKPIESPPHIKTTLTRPSVREFVVDTKLY